MQHADDVVGRAAPQRQPGDAGGEHGVDDSLRRLVGIEHDHLGAMDHDVGDRQLAQIEQAAHHVAVELFHDAGAMHEIDGAAQFLARRQDRLDLADRHAEAAQNEPHQPFDRPQERREHAHVRCDRLRDRERHAIGRVEGGGLRQHFGEDEDQHRHHDAWRR